MTDNELEERLNRLGRDRTPPVDGAFANRLEADLRNRNDQPAGGFSFPDLLLRPAAVIAALVVVLGVVAALRSGDDQISVAMVAADGTTVSIPGGDALEAGRAGLDLPDGTRIEVGEGGAAVVAGVVLEAGSTAIVVDGRLDVLESPAVTATEPPGTTAVPRTTTTAATDTTATTEPAARPSTTAAPDSSAPTTTGDDPPRTTIPSTTIDDPPRTTVPATNATTTSRPSVTVAPTSTTVALGNTTATTKPLTISPDEPTIALRIGAVRDGAATLIWAVEGSTDDIEGWEVRVIRGDTVKTIALIRVADARRLRVEVPGPRTAYRVIARSGGDGVVARSALVSPGG